MASRPSASSSNHFPSRSWALTRTFSARWTSSRAPGKLRHPSSKVVVPSVEQNLGVHEDAEVARLALVRAVDDEDLPELAYLRGRKADAGGRVHGLGHVVDELAQLGRERLDLLARPRAAARRGSAGCVRTMSLDAQCNRPRADASPRRPTSAASAAPELLQRGGYFSDSPDVRVDAAHLPLGVADAGRLAGRGRARPSRPRPGGRAGRAGSAR